MLNITRNPNKPASLNAIEIQQYIENTIQHLADPDNIPEPNKPTTYRTSDLLEAFDSNFYSKCYLTEQNFENSWAMDIEHFIPQSERPDLVYEWNNLYPAEHLANMMKPRRTPPGGYLDPCNLNDNVETEIVYTLSTLGYDPEFVARDIKNVKAINTCKLLSHIHNGSDDKTQKSTASLRHAIHKKYIEILKKTIEWQGALEGSQEKNQAARELRDMLSRKSSFTMLCRSMPSVIQNIPAQFFD